MIKSVFFYGFLLFFSMTKFSSCTVDKDDKKELPDCAKTIESLKRDKAVSNDGPACIVLCDFSSSMDTASIRFVKERAFEIFDHYFDKANLQFYMVTNASKKPAYASELITIADSNKITRAKNGRLKNCLTSIKRDRDSELHAVLEQEFTNRPRATYIIQSIVNAIDIIHVQDPGHKKKNTIFILSDMREFGSSSLGSFNLEDKNYEEDIQKLQSVEGKTYVSSDYNNIDIKVGFYSLQPQNITDLKKFWKLVFQKLGYPRQVAITPELKFLP